MKSKEISKLANDILSAVTAPHKINLFTKGRFKIQIVIVFVILLALLKQGRMLLVLLDFLSPKNLFYFFHRINFDTLIYLFSHFTSDDLCPHR